MFVFGSLAIQLLFVMRELKAANLMQVFNTDTIFFGTAISIPPPHEINFVTRALCSACENINGVFAPL
jgi:hypothetical protein